MRGIHTAVAALCLAAITIAVVVTAGPPSARPDQVPGEIRVAAEVGLKTFLGAAGGGGLDRLGFRNSAETAGATVGDGFQVYKVMPDRLLSGGATDFDTLAVPTTLWQFVVVSGNAPRSVLTVDRMNDAWTAVSLGASGLAEQLTAVVTRWPVSTYQLRFVRSYQANADVMEISQGGKVLGAVPFLSARVSLGGVGAFDPNDVWPVEQVVTRMRPVVKAAMEQK